MTGAQMMVESLREEGVQVVFGYPGATICPFYDALAQSDIRHVLVRQEMHAGHAASGYARVTGRVGVCAATSGPGALGLLMGVATAYMDSIPLVAITGQVACDQLGRDVFQELDVTGAAASFVKYSYLVKDARELPRIFREAFHIAATGRPGPVLIDVPIDIQLADGGAFHYPEHVDLRGYKPTKRGHALQIGRVAEAVRQARRPVICAGGGVISGRAADKLLAFAEHTRIPIVSTMMGLGAFDSDHPLYFGMVGIHGHAAANRAMRESDLILFMGARIGDRAIFSNRMVSPDAVIVHIDVDPAEIGKNMATRIPIVGRLGHILPELQRRCEPADTGDFLAELTACKTRPAEDAPARPGYVNPKLFIRRLSERMPDGQILACDVGQNQLWVARNTHIHHATLLFSGGFGAMGYSLGAAVGAAIGAPERPVIALCGDGAFQMAMMELGTLTQEGLPIKVVVINNHRLGMISEIQQGRYEGREFAIEMGNRPDLLTIAAAYGIASRRLSADGEIDSAVRMLLAAKGPFLLECVVDPNESTL